jgi:hypothetical protein
VGISVSAENESSFEAKVFVLSRIIGTRYGSQIARYSQSSYPYTRKTFYHPAFIVTRSIYFVFSLWLLMLKS